MTLILSLLGGAWGFIKRLLDLAARYPWQAALICALALSAWLYAGKHDALATVAKRDATIAAMIKASDEASEAQKKLNKGVTDKQTDIARKADANETNRRDIAARSSDYASRMSAQSYCRETNPAAESAAAESGNGTSADAVMVSRADFDVLTGNTARLLNVKAWGDDLIAEGLAIEVGQVQPVPE